VLLAIAMGWKPVLQNELPMVTIPIQPGDSSSHASSRATAPPSVCSQETQEAAKSVGFGLGFTLCLLSLLSGHAAATLGALAARGSSRPTVVAARGHSNTSAGLAGALRLGPNCAAPEGPAAATYTQALSELHEASARVGYGRLGKGSRLGFEGIRAKVQGVAYHQVVSMHPPSGWTAGGAFATFALPPVPSGDDTEQTPGDGGAAGATRRWCALRGAVAINDGNNWIGRAGSPLTFSVRDGTTDELLWLSEPIQVRPLAQLGCRWADVCSCTRSLSKI
jgi:hypothetical protein